MALIKDIELFEKHSSNDVSGLALHRRNRKGTYWIEGGVRGVAILPLILVVILLTCTGLAGPVVFGIMVGKIDIEV